jgi:hypothetical protein
VGAFHTPGVETFAGSSHCITPGVLAVSSLLAGVRPPSRLEVQAGVRLPDAGPLEPDPPHAGVREPEPEDPPQAGVLDPEPPHAGVFDPELFHAGVLLELFAFHAGVRDPIPP